MIRKLKVLGAGAMAITALAAGGARAQTVNVSVDATAAGTPLEKVWPYHGFDEVNYSTTAEGKALLQTLAAAHSAPVHVRTHFLLNTGDGTPSLKWGSTNIYTEDASGNPVYSWTLMDGIMDAITGAGAFPFTEIAFMPQALSTMPTPYKNSSVTALDGGCFYPPKDYTKWSNLIKTWAMHESARYPNVDSAWLWELWNEPDIGYWHGTFADYAKLYDYTEAALHQVMPNAQLGGPAVATAGGTFLTQFLTHCASGTNAATGATGARLDLVTFHAKGGTAIVNNHVEMDLGNQLRLHRSGMTAVANATAFKAKPIYITEADPDGCAACPATTTPADAYRFSPAYGAYEVAMMKRTLELEARLGVKLGGLLTWAFTFPGTPYFAGYRALATNGIDLPVLGAFKLLGSLDGTRLSVTSSGALTLDAILNNGVRGQADVDAMATLAGQKVSVLVWNYHDDMVTATAAPVSVAVKLPASFGARVSVAHLRVDDTHGDAYTVWTSQGSPASPSAAQITALQQAMEPASLGAQTVDVTAGAVTITFDLPRFGLSLLTITPASSSPDAGTDARPDAAAPDAASGAAGASGASGTGGLTGTAGTGGISGAAGTSALGTGGVTGTAGAISSGTAGTTASGTGGIAGSQAGTIGTTGAAGSNSGGLAGSSGSPGTPGSGARASSGCSCALASHDDPRASLLAITLALAVIARRRQRRTGPRREPRAVSS
jgi:xylan 1,4-beta-xylosidase